MALITRSNILYVLVGAVIILYGIYTYNEAQMKKAAEEKKNKKEGFLDLAKDVFPVIGYIILGLLVLGGGLLVYIKFQEGTLTAGLPSVSGTASAVRGSVSGAASAVRGSVASVASSVKGVLPTKASIKSAMPKLGVPKISVPKMPSFAGLRR